MEDQTNVAPTTNSDSQASLLGGEAIPAEPASTDTSTEGEAPAAEGTDASGEDQPASDADQSEPQDGPPEKYEFTAPEGHELAPEVLQEYSEVAREVGLSQEKAQAIVDKLAPAMARQQQAQIEAISQEWSEQSKNDKEFGGEKLQENLGVAKKALDKFGTPELTEFLNTTGLGNHPGIIRLLYKAGKTISEDGFVDGAKPGQKKTGQRSFADTANVLYPEKE